MEEDEMPGCCRPPQEPYKEECNGLRPLEEGRADM